MKVLLWLILLVLWDTFESIVLSRRVSRTFRLSRAFYRLIHPSRFTAKDGAKCPLEQFKDDSQQTGVEVGCVSTGPERNQTIVVPDSRFEKIFG